MAAATGGDGSTVASSSTVGSHASKVPTGELGSSLSSAFQKKVCVCVCVRVRACVCVYAVYMLCGCVCACAMFTVPCNACF